MIGGAMRILSIYLATFLGTSAFAQDPVILPEIFEDEVDACSYHIPANWLRAREMMLAIWHISNGPGVAYAAGQRIPLPALDDAVEVMAMRGETLEATVQEGGIDIFATDPSVVQQSGADRDLMLHLSIAGPTYQTLTTVAESQNVPAELLVATYGGGINPCGIGDLMHLTGQMQFPIEGEVLIMDVRATVITSYRIELLLHFTGTIQGYPFSAWRAATANLVHPGSL
jgi:hypothetical protein